MMEITYIEFNDNGKVVRLAGKFKNENRTNFIEGDVEGYY